MKASYHNWSPKGSYQSRHSFSQNNNYHSLTTYQTPTNHIRQISNLVSLNHPKRETCPNMLNNKQFVYSCPRGQRSHIARSSTHFTWDGMRQNVHSLTKPNRSLKRIEYPKSTIETINEMKSERSCKQSVRKLSVTVSQPQRPPPVLPMKVSTLKPQVATKFVYLNSLNPRRSIINAVQKKLEERLINERLFCY